MARISQLMVDILASKQYHSKTHKNASITGVFFIGILTDM